jgi:FkbM family methyltransferase
MRVADREIAEIALAPFRKRHYRALHNMMRVSVDFPSAFGRYITNSGRYPWQVRLRTPIGVVAPTLYSYHDLLTVNEIFFRRECNVDSDATVVVDIGANIGISSLFFLTRNPDVRCYLYEPDPSNVERLQANLADFEDRIAVIEAAVADYSGTVEFGVEETGRYGAVGAQTGRTIEVACRHINDVLDSVLQSESRIDLLKLDVGGLESATIAAIDSRYLPNIGRIAWKQTTGDISAVRRWEAHRRPESAVGLHAVLPLAIAYGAEVPIGDGSRPHIELRDLSWLEQFAPVEGDRVIPAPGRNRRDPD